MTRSVSGRWAGAATLALTIGGSAAFLVGQEPAPKATRPPPVSPPQGKAATPKPEATPAPVPAPPEPAPPLTPEDEARLEAREDVELLEAYVKAKTTQARQAVTRVELARGYWDDARRKKDIGTVAPVVVTQRAVALAEAETERDFRLAELKDFEVRLKRARRRLAGLERPD